MKVKTIAVVAALAGVVFAHAAGFDGKALTTNDWFDASFTAGTVDTVIAQGDTTGITRGAGSWTAVPATGTAKIASDADAGGEATLLSIEAPGEELTFTPVALSETNGMETLVVNFKAEAVDSLTPPEGGAQGAFAIYSADGTAHSLAAYVSDGSSGVWTNLVYANAADLTNVWVVLTMDFATVDSVRYVRYSITPPSGSLTVLADSEGTEWFRSANASAKVVDSVSFSGIGSVRTFSGDSLDEVKVARYNGVDYATVAEAIAAGESDGWANGNVTLLANATWTPTAAGTYEHIDVASFTLDASASEYTLTVDTAANTVTASRIYTWNGSADTWLSAANWTVGNDSHTATTYPGEVTTEPFTVVFGKNATFSSAETVDISGLNMNVEAAGYAVTLPNLTVTPGTDAAPETITRLVSGTVRYSNYARHRVMIDEDATLVIDQDIAANKDNYYRYFMGEGSIIVDNATLNATHQYGSMVRAFNGTFTLSNGAKLVTTSNNADTFIGTGKFVFAGGTVQKDGTYGKTHDFGSASIDVVAGTANICDMPVPLGKVTVVAGVVALDAERQYVVLTATKSTTGTMSGNAVDSTLAADNWSVIQSTNASGQAILVLAHSPTYSWTGSAGDNLWATPENWIVGDYVPASAPGEGDTVSITTEAESLDVIVANGQNVGTLTKGENVSLAGPGPYEVTITEGVVSLTRVPSVFVYNSENDGSWPTASNWTVNGRATDVYPNASDTAQFNSEATINLAWNYDISNVVVKADVTIDGSSTYYLKGICELQSETPAGATRAPRIILNNAGLQSRDIYDNPVTWLADVEVVGTCELRAYTANTGSNPSSIRYNGNLHGSGSLKCWASGGSNRRSGVVLGGDNGDFNGSIEIQSGNIGSPGSTRTAPFFGAVTAGSSNAVWTITGNDNVSDSLTDMRALKGTESVPNKLYFGALNGTWRVFTGDSKGDYYNHYIEFVIGGANQDCTFNPLFSRANNAERCDSQVSIRKVGNGKLTIVGESDMTSVYAYYVDGGTLEFTYNHCLTSYSKNTPGPLAFGGGTLAFANSYTNNLASAEADPDESIKDVSSYVKNSTGPISVCFAEGQTSTWATALAASNTGGLVKKGAGTLTLSKKPLYTGDTYLYGGTLKIVDTWDGKVRTHEKGKSVYVDTTSTPGYKTFTLGHRRSVMIIVQ